MNPFIIEDEDNRNFLIDVYFQNHPIHLWLLHGRHWSDCLWHPRHQAGNVEESSQENVGWSQTWSNQSSLDHTALSESHNLRKLIVLFRGKEKSIVEAYTSLSFSSSHPMPVSGSIPCVLVGQVCGEPSVLWVGDSAGYVWQATIPDGGDTADDGAPLQWRRKQVDRKNLNNLIQPTLFCTPNQCLANILECRCTGGQHQIFTGTRADKHGCQDFQKLATHMASSYHAAPAAQSYHGPSWYSGLGIRICIRRL